VDHKEKNNETLKKKKKKKKKKRRRKMCIFLAIYACAQYLVVLQFYRT